MPKKFNNFEYFGRGVFVKTSLVNYNWRESYLIEKREKQREENKG